MQSRFTVFEVTFLERIFKWNSEKLLSGKQPVKDTDDSHAIEYHFVLIDCASGSTMQLQLESRQILAIGWRLQHVRKHVWSHIDRMTFNN